ncbi:uncharacterized protein LOC127011649 [Drosophila biarmipes]|uniref:uncharacterized protein LOC127011649 n=1 Tax=Drosophila biarmipes TaxID=125945 RepID=UPI0021CCCE9B|nr:uncharacterized protein LOC127011649 [Drosophila biarmipes]
MIRCHRNCVSPRNMAVPSSNAIRFLNASVLDTINEIDHLEIPETQDSDDEIIANSDQEVVDASETEDSVDLLLQEYFNLLQLLNDESHDQFQCGQEIELDESIPTEMFPDDDHIF